MITDPKIGDKVRYQYSPHEWRQGSIIELDEKTQRARVQWPRVRTWVRYAALYPDDKTARP